MDKTYEKKYHSLENYHWWFASRRRKVIEMAEVAPGKTYLDVGCSTGVLLEKLIEAGAAPEDVYGVDISKEAIERCHEKGLNNTDLGDGAKVEGFEPNSFDCIVASDCLEHIEDDAAALRRWYELLKPGGRLIVFVPAFMSLWSPHDVVNHHFRRYTLPELERKMKAHRFRLLSKGYWNFTLFLPILLFRTAKNLKAKIAGEKMPREDLNAPNPAVNKLLFGLLNTENRLMDWVRYPFGVSTFCIGTKQQDR